MSKGKMCIALIVVAGGAICLSNKGRAFDAESKTPQFFGAVGDGVADDTAALSALLGSGGKVHIPRGVYRIASQGPSAGGVIAKLRQSLSVSCADGAVFKADELDRDMIRIYANGADGTTPSIQWSGCTWDQRRQKNSTVQPYNEKWAPANQGSSATTDGLSFRSLGGGKDRDNQYLFDRIDLRGLNFIASDGDWRSGGGDSAVFAEGYSSISISGSTFSGSRDVAVYLSGLQSDPASQTSEVIGNKFVKCIFGISAKRSIRRVAVEGNSFKSVAIPIVVTPIIGPGSSDIKIQSNEASDFWIGVRLDAVNGGEVSANKFSNIGYSRVWGSQDGVFSKSIVFQLNGSSHINIKSNVIYSKWSLGKEDLYHESDKIPGLSVKMNYSDNAFSPSNRVVTPSGR